MTNDPTPPPNILFVITDQQRFDTINALGNADIHTPNLDRLVQRGVSFTRAYSTCPACVPARYNLRTGCEPTRTGIVANRSLEDGEHDRIRTVCGPYLAETMQQLGYRTFGVGKFHTTPWNAAVGYQDHCHSEEMYATPEQRAGDGFASWIATEHPGLDWIEALMGERTEMYYMPQMSPLPAAQTVESWATDRAIEFIDADPDHPWFGFVSYIGPHPPFAPPLPFNRMYDPDRMPSPVTGDLAVDHLDQQIPSMNYMTFAEDVDDTRARTLKARYYGEISYIDECLGRLLDAVEAGPDPDNTVICFTSDHGELLGDHHGWQKESFFEASTRVPLLLSWPRRLPSGVSSEALACLTDLFGIATTAAGRPELRQGADLVGNVLGAAPERELLFGYYGQPGTETFKVMVRGGSHKLIWHANGGGMLLFDLAQDPDELTDLSTSMPEVADRLLTAAKDQLRVAGIDAAFGDHGELHTTPYQIWPLQRIYQFDRSRDVQGFPDDPANVVR